MTGGRKPKATAKDKAIALREEADALKYFRLAEAEAEAEADRARAEAGNARTDVLAALEMEKIRLEAMQGGIAEMVKPAEKINGICINNIGGKSGEALSPINSDDKIDHGYGGADARPEQDW